MVGNFFISFFTNFVSDQKSPPLSSYDMRRLPKTLHNIKLKDTVRYLHLKKTSFLGKKLISQTLISFYNFHHSTYFVIEVFTP